jgi:hypothetical protein
MNENNFNTKILYPEKLSFKIDGAIKVIHDRQTKTIYDDQSTITKESSTNSPKEVQATKTMKGQAVQNHRRKNKKVESNIDSAVHNQTLKQRKLNDRNQYTI